MKKITLFFCDIYGTFTEGSSLCTNIGSIKKFVHNLDNIRKAKGSDKVIFSFITTEDLETVLSMEKILSESITEEDISIGLHFCNDANHPNINKPFEIINYINYLRNYYIIDQVYYADDCELYHSILDDLKLYYKVDCCINSIIPKNNGLIDVNHDLENILISFDDKKINIIH